MTTEPRYDPARLELLLARDEIREVLARYARAVDRADGPLLKSCYHPDAIEEHGGNYAGNAHEYVDGAIPRIRTMGAMQHLLGSSHIELDGDVAWVETYILTFARFAQPDGRSLDTFTGGRLVDRFERRGGAWKIAHRRTVFDWNRDEPSNQGWCSGLFDPAKPGMHLGCKGTSDASYERF
jgi:ketosteroid isomerase-like protein